MKILVVDDSAIIRDRLVEELSELPGVEHVGAASRASEARRAIQSARPDVVVLDIHMPYGSGLEVLHALRADPRPVTTIVLTNDPTPHMRDVCLRAGADFFLDKSAEFQRAVEVVARLALGNRAPGTNDRVPDCWTGFERLPIPAWIFDVDTLEFRAVNDAAVLRYGYSRDEFLAMTVEDIRLPEDVPELMERMTRRRAGAPIQMAGVRRHRARDGTAIHVEFTATPFDRVGQRLDLVLAHDISERVLAEEALRTSESRYRELFENATDAIFTTSLDLDFTSFNSVAEALTGYTREEALGLNVAALVSSDALEIIRRRLADQLAGTPASMFEATILARDGRRVPIEVNARLVYRDGRPIGTQGIARDISERKRLERGLRQGQKMEAIGQLAGGVAHDFNNLLTVIMGRSREMIERLPADDPAHADAIQIFDAGESAAALTRQLLAFSRQQILAPRVIDLNASIAHLSPMLGRLIGEDVEVAIRTASERCAVKADPWQLEQVIMNLVVNARDAMPQGGALTIETAHVSLDASDVADLAGLEPGQYVELVVSDTGHGMDAQTKAHLFEPFFTTKDAGRGTGLGLSTVYGIVKQSGGDILVESEPGRGSVFRLYFRHATGEIEPARAAMPAGDRPERGTESILLVEDDGGVREFARRALIARGYDVIATSSPDQAQQLCDSRGVGVDLLITDMVMPGMTGRALARILCARHPRMKVIYMSGYTTEAIVDQGELDPSMAFVGKPFTGSGLATKVREVLDGGLTA